MSRKQAIGLLLATVAGNVVDAQQITFGKSQDGSTGTIIKITNKPQTLSIMLSDTEEHPPGGYGGIGTIRVEYNGQTREISAREIWESLVP